MSISIDGSGYEKGKRLYNIDILRGLAIFTMVAANMSGLLTMPHPFLFRWYGSFAAPLFIALSGFMVALTQSQGSNRGWHFMKRGALLLLTAAIIDMTCFGILPFLGVDVLYLIGVALPLVYLLSKLPSRYNQRIILILGMIILCVAPLLRRIFGYTKYPTEYPIYSEASSSVYNSSLVLNHWFIDGWFPLFPWLGICIFGFALGHSYVNGGALAKGAKSTAVGLVLLIAGLLHWQWHSGAMMVRYTYSEVFYPPTFGFTLMACGVILLLWQMISRTQRFIIWRPLSWLGQCSLFMYIAHLFLISFVLKSIFKKTNLPHFFGIYSGFIVVLMVMGWLLQRYKQRNGGFKSFAMRFYFGG